MFAFKETTTVLKNMLSIMTFIKKNDRETCHAPMSPVMKFLYLKNLGRKKTCIIATQL